MVAAVVVVVAVLAGGCRKAPEDLTVEVVLDGLEVPWDVDFLPDGTLLVTERPGRLQAVVDGAPRLVAELADVTTTGPSGLMGLAVDPAFATNRAVYVCLSSDLPPGPTRDVRVARLTLDADVTTATDRVDIVTGIHATAQSQHSGCQLAFGPDGHLWIGTGDSRTPTDPQDPTSLAGKVLRVTRDGEPAAGNPGAPLDPRIYSYGHRNIQRLAFRPSDGEPFAVEHGTACDDEVNHLVAGGNYGWHPVDPLDAAHYDESRPMTDLEAFPDAVEAEWSSGCPTIAPSGGTFLDGPQWAGWDGALAMAVLKDRSLWVWWSDPDGEHLPLAWTALEGEARLRAAVQGPDGSLYVTTDQASPSDRVLRITPAGS